MVFYQFELQEQTSKNDYIIIQFRMSTEGRRSQPSSHQHYQIEDESDDEFQELQQPSCLNSTGFKQHEMATFDQGFKDVGVQCLAQGHSSPLDETIHIKKERDQMYQKCQKLYRKYQQLQQQSSIQAEKIQASERQWEAVKADNQSLKVEIKLLNKLLVAEKKRGKQVDEEILMSNSKITALEQTCDLLDQKVAGLKSALGQVMGVRLLSGDQRQLKSLDAKFVHFHKVMAKVNELFKQIAEKNAPYKLLNQEESADELSKLECLQRYMFKQQTKIQAQCEYLKKLEQDLAAANKKLEGSGFAKWFEPVVKFCKIEDSSERKDTTKKDVMGKKSDLVRTETAERRNATMKKQ